MLFYVLMGTFLIITLLFLLNHVWKKRHIYYCAWKLPGPLTLPFVGSVFAVAAMQVNKDQYSALMELCRRHKSIFKVGILDDLYVVSSEPEDVEILLKTCLGKPPFYTTWDDMINDNCNIVTAPVHIWKEQRKEFNRSFNTQILDTYHHIFSKYAKEVVNVLKPKCGQVNTNFFFDTWRSDMDIYLESLVDIDPQLLNEHYEFLNLIVRAEEIIMERFRNIRLMLNPLYRLSCLRKEAKVMAAETLRLVGKVITLKKSQFFDDDFTQDELRMKRLFNQLWTSLNKKAITEENFQAESIAMAVAASETTALSKTYIILILGILPDIQEKVYQEICSVAPDADDFSPEDINKMEYLGRVIKETLRLFPAIPVIMRSVDKDTKLKSYVQPAGTHVIIPIVQIHKNPELWPDPLKFDPDRFLPEEVEKRHRCAYIPFSFGSRNCIGLKYAMISMKVMVAQIVRQFVIKTLDCNSLEDIEIEFKMMNHPKNYRIVFEERFKGI